MNGSAHRDKERHTLDLYQSASAGYSLEPGRRLQTGIFFVSLRLVLTKFQMESEVVPSDGSGLSRTIAVVQMHVWLSFVRFCICVLNSLNRVVESLSENFL